MSFLLKFVDYGKLIGGAILAGLAFFGWYKYSSKVEKVKDLEDYVEQKEKIIEAQDKQAVVADKVHEAEVDNVTLEKDVAINETVVEHNIETKRKKTHAKIDKAEEGVPYDLDA